MLLLFAAAELGHYLSFSPDGFATIWPPSGILLAILLANPRREWPMLFATAYAASLANNFHHGLPAALAFFYPAANAAGALAGALLISRTTKEVFSFHRVRHALAFYVWAGVVSTFVDALTASTVMTVLESSSLDARDLFLYWISAATGMVMFAPPTHLLLSYRRSDDLSRPRVHAVAALACGILAVLLAAWIFLGKAPISHLAWSPGLIFPLLVLASVFGDALGGTLCSLAVALVGAYGTTRGFGPFHAWGESETEQVAAIQIMALDFQLISVIVGIAIQKAKAASRAKTLFLANVSQELRTPLTAILGFSELMERPNIPDAERRAFQATVTRNARALGVLVDDLLDVSSIEAGRVQMHLEEVGLRDLLAEVLAAIDLKLHGGQVRLVERLAQDVPGKIITDRLRLRQILWNILGNAVKFTREGLIELAVESTTSARGAAVAFYVKDSGVGMDPKQARDLFRPFTQLDASATRQYGGAGLGLALSRQLARMLGGDVQLARSEPGKGSTFVVTVACDGGKSQNGPLGLFSALRDPPPARS